MIKPLRSISLLVIFIISIKCQAQDTGKALFDNSYLHEIRFESSLYPNIDLWDSLSLLSYQMVNLIIDGTEVDSVGLRFKGRTSYASPQKPLKVDINEFVRGKKIDGLKKFNLNNNFNDSYMQREALAYELYKRSGLPVPRTSYAEVYVGNIFKGVYSLTEQIDKTYLKDRFPSNNGSLYKGAYGGLIPPSIFLETKEGTESEIQSYINNQYHRLLLPTV